MQGLLEHVLADEPFGKVPALYLDATVVEDILRTRVGVATVALLDALAVDMVGWPALAPWPRVLWCLLLVVVEPTAFGRLGCGSVPVAGRHVEGTVGVLAGAVLALTT